MSLRQLKWKLGAPLAMLVASTLVLVAPGTSCESLNGEESGNSSLDASTNLAHDNGARNDSMMGESPGLEHESAGGASRSVGGIGADVFPWIVILWLPPHRKYNEQKSAPVDKVFDLVFPERYRKPGDSWLTGLGIRYSNSWMLADMESVLRSTTRRADFTRSVLQFKLQNSPPSYTQYIPTSSIDVSKGRASPSMEEAEPSTTQRDYWTTLGAGIAVFSMVPGGRNGPGEFFTLKKDELPVLQDDKLANEACWLYSYSFPYVGPSAGTPSNSTNNRTFSRWPLDVVERGPVTKLKLRWSDPKEEKKYGGELCGYWSDVGAPVVCGTDPPKLSYIVVRQEYQDSSSEASQCRREFKALRIADHIHRLPKEKDLININIV